MEEMNKYLLNLIGQILLQKDHETGRRIMKSKSPYSERIKDVF